MLFMNTLRAPYLGMLVRGVTSFDNLVIVGKMIENAMKSGKIKAEKTRGGITLKNEEEAQAVFLESQPNEGYTPYPSYPPCYPEINHTIPTPYIYQLPRLAYPTAQTINLAFNPQTHQSGIENSDRGPKLKKEKYRLDPIPLTYIELLHKLIANHIVMPVVLKPLTPPYPKWYNPNAHYEYHSGILSHSTEDCTPFKYKVQGLVRLGALNFDEHGITVVSLLDHMED